MKAARIAGYLYAGLIASAHAESIRVASQGNTLVDAASGQTKVQVVLKTHKMEIGKPADPRPAVIESNCTYSKFPCSLVDGLTIHVNGNALFVPRSVFADLADLNTVDVKPAGKVWDLTISGGDGSEGFIVRITFDTEQVVRRTLASAISPKKPLQETVYHQIAVGD